MCETRSCMFAHDRFSGDRSLKGASVSPQPRRADLRRRSVTTAAMVVAAIVVPVAIAYACNPQAHVSLDKSAYQPGAAITVNGSFFPNSTPVTVSGPPGSVPVTQTVQTSSGGGFTTTITAPATPGNY